jgi:hypothetical protein
VAQPATIVAISLFEKNNKSGTTSHKSGNRFEKTHKTKVAQKMPVTIPNREIYQADDCQKSKVKCGRRR